MLILSICIICASEVMDVCACLCVGFSPTLLLSCDTSCKLIHPSWMWVFWTSISQTSVHGCDCDLAVPLKLAMDPATPLRTYLCQPYLETGFYPPCWLLLWYFSVSHSVLPSLLPLLFPPSPVSRISSIIHLFFTPFLGFPSHFLSPFLLLVACFDSGCASLVGEDGAP